MTNAECRMSNVELMTNDELAMSFRAESRNPVALLLAAHRDPSTPLRFAQDDWPFRNLDFEIPLAFVICPNHYLACRMNSFRFPKGAWKRN
jgi:hypothetical protein